ncbi:P-loop containing nucleoside triphosphate hydrolase protein [Immersiella caudata]|uniref:P-loop containing nucleoside triphosphate hydrolase protein n=1 Tax=Immersiella caudata TaxID=314043 RepID=A0AA39WQ16_9PEZI|nr:P-loop containing nucleoside triphosphate hydrolase protein [Immersiella caudata]
MEAPKTEVLIALVGITGAGKTTFASVASGRTDLVIGYGVDPCTQDPEAIDFQLDNHKVVLIDTPGFDDDARSDLEILEDIGQWLVREGFSKNHQLDGLILLHPITHNRVGGMERKRTKLLEKILGSDACKRVVIATTMWDDLVSEDAMMGRIEGRMAEGGVWADMVRQGATIVRHRNNQGSAHDIIRRIIRIANREGKVKPLLQLEMVQNQGKVFETSAGKELKEQLEEEIAHLMSQILDHRKERPPESWRKSRNGTNRRAWKEWDQERHELAKKLEMRQSQLKKLSGLVVSLAYLATHPDANDFEVRVKSFWRGLFGKN